MNEVSQQYKKSHQKHIITIVIIIVTAFALSSLWLTIAKPFETYPLDDKLEYIGKDNYGCYIFCDSTPAAIYYYATDMDVNEIITHFSKTTLEKEPTTIDNETEFGLKTSSSETIYFYYYDSPESVHDEGLRKTDKRHILSLPSFKYNLAKESL
jgi:hypothetical protein